VLQRLWSINGGTFYAADLLRTPFNYYAPREKQIRTLLWQNPFPSMTGFDMAVQIRNTGVMSSAAREVRRIS